jgi:YbbR domain-containing protein
MIISLLASLTIWIYVTSGETEAFKTTFRNVQIEIVGEDTLRTSRGLILTDLNTSSVTVEVVGPRRMLAPLDSDDLVAVVDVSKLTRASYTTLKYDIVYPSTVDERYISEEKKSPEYVNFNISLLTDKTIPVRGGFEGRSADGYTAETPVFEPSTITVTGPEAYLKDISYAWVTFGQNVIVDSSYSIETNFTLMNEDGDAVSTEYLTLSQDTIRATLPILQVKNVPLEVDVIEGAGASKANTKISIEPNTVTLAGDSSILSGMNKIVLDTIDLTDFSSTLTETYPIAINNELRNVTGVTEAKVTLEVVGLETRSFRVSNLSYINSADGTNVEILTEGLDVQIRGTAEQLDLIKAESIRAVADLTDFKDSTGSYMPTVKIYVDGVTDVGAIGTYTISVEIRKA